MPVPPPERAASRSGTRGRARPRTRSRRTAQRAGRRPQSASCELRRASVAAGLQNGDMPSKASIGVAAVAVAAGLWGMDALIRRPLALSTEPATIVFGEHVVLVAVLLPVVFAALPALWRAGPRFVAAGIVIGAGILGARHDPLHPGVRGRRSRDAGRPAEGAAADRGVAGGGAARRAPSRPLRRLSRRRPRRGLADGVSEPVRRLAARTGAGLLRARRGGALGARNRARPLSRARAAFRAGDRRPLRVRAARGPGRGPRPGRAADARHCTTSSSSRCSRSSPASSRCSSTTGG